MDTTSIDQLNESKADMILCIEPSSVMLQIFADDVIPAYGLRQKLVEAPTEGMLFEVDNRYRNQEEFAFCAWSPHWMNQRYSLRYLEDPKDAWGPLNDPASITTIVNKDLPKNDPEATAFMDALMLDEDQLGDLENTINEASDPHEGAKRWAQDNSEVWQPWVEAAQGVK
jgi:glycine betaine/proline transport system substrate-binding protein